MVCGGLPLCMQLVVTVNQGLVIAASPQKFITVKYGGCGIGIAPQLALVIERFFIFSDGCLGILWGKFGLALAPEIDNRALVGWGQIRGVSLQKFSNAGLKLKQSGGILTELGEFLQERSPL